VVQNYDSTIYWYHKECNTGTQFFWPQEDITQK